MAFDYREKILSTLFKSYFTNFNIQEKHNLEDYLNLIEYYNYLEVPLPKMEKSGLETMLDNEILIESEQMKNDPTQVDLNKISRIILSAKKAHLDIAYELVSNIFTKILNQEIIAFGENLDISKLQEVMRLMDFANQCQLSFKRKFAENYIYNFLEERLITIIETYNQDKNNLPKRELIESVILCAEKLNINVDKYKELLHQ